MIPSEDIPVRDFNLDQEDYAVFVSVITKWCLNGLTFTQIS